MLVDEEETKTQIKLFEEQKVRTVWDSEKEEWYFSVVDVVGILTESENPRNYWKVLKHRLSEEGSQLVTNCNQLKMPAADGKMYKTDCMTTEQVFRLIQSIPSPKAEPFKLWMAQVAKERLDEMQDPEQGIQRALQEYRALGYSENWINVVRFANLPSLKVTSCPYKLAFNIFSSSIKSLEISFCKSLISPIRTFGAGYSTFS